MSQAINQVPIQWCDEARAHKNDNFASILVSEVSAEDDVTVAEIITTQQFDSTMESHTQDVRGGEEPVNSLRKSEKEEQFLTAQGRPGKLFNHCKSWPWRDQMALHFLLHLPQDNSHSEWKNSGHSITCNKSQGRGRGVGRQRTELLRTYSCYKAISEKNWNIKN